MSAFEGVPVRGIEGTPTTPFFSPDGQSLGYWDSSDNQIRRIRITGGTPVGGAEAGNLWGASWEADNTILFASDTGIWSVSDSGGSPEQLIQLEPGEYLQSPQLLPDGESLLFSRFDREHTQRMG